MGHVHRTFILFSLFAALAAISGAHALADHELTAGVITSQDWGSGLPERIPVLLEKAKIPGLSIALIKDGSITWQQGFGVMSLETGAPVTEETVLEAASLSKPVFAYAVLQLVDEGRFDLDTPLLEYVPQEYFEQEFLRGKLEDERFRLVTARMVMSHTTGLPNWRRGGALQFTNNPGEKFGYSGEGIVFLQKVIERITGESCNEFVSRRVFEPFGMTSSSYVWRDDYDKLAAASHDLFMAASPMRKNTTANAAASLKTTAGDYARFLIAVINGERLKPETHRALLTPQSETGSAGVKWGLGIGLQESGNGWSVWHWGDNGDFKAFAIGNVNNKNGVVFFANSFNGLAVVNEMVESVLGEDNPVLASGFLEDYPRFDSDPFRLYNAYIDGGLDDFSRLYQELMLNPDHEKRGINEGLINQFGYALIWKKRYPDAIEVFKLNVAAYPASSNVYDSLGEAYMANGDVEPALTNYRKSLELNPGNDNARQAIDKLELAVANIQSACGWRQYTTPEEAGFDSNAIEEARKYATEIGTAAVMAVYDGRVLASWGSVDFPYMCHSVRKSFLSALYGIHVATGEIDINKTLAELGIDDVPPLSEQEKQAKISDMLKARSGVYHPAAYETESMKAARPARDSHAPGTFWYYNNWDFNTLGYIFEKETGKNIFEEFKSRFADPLGMEDFDLRHCYYHLEVENSIYPAYPFRLSTRDAARFGELFLQKGSWAGKQIIPESWITESTKSYSKARSGGYAYMWWTHSVDECHELGLENLAAAGGLYTAQGVGGQVIAVIDGADMVLVSRTDTDRDKSVNTAFVFKLADMILAAKTGKPAEEPKLTAMAAIPFEGAEEPPVLHVEIEMDPAVYGDYVGTYRSESASEMVLEVVKENDRLWATMTGESTVELFPEAPDRFFIKAGNAQVEFLRDESGAVTHLILHYGGQELKAQRMEK